mgnify:CR=1 FL=1
MATALVLVALPAAALVGSWSTPADLSATGRDASEPQVTVSSTGLATAVWYSNDGSNKIIQSSTLYNQIPTTTTTTTTPTLAKTGANVEWLMVAGLIAVIAGAGFLTVIRRKRTA